MSSVANPAYLRTFSGVIWKLVYDAHYNQLALEIRSDSNLDWFYHILDLNKMSDHQVFLHDHVDWWSQLAGIYDDKLIIMKYEGQNNPGPGTLMICDHRNNKLEFSQEGLLIDSIESGKINGVQVEKEGKKKEFTLQLENTKRPQKEIQFPAFFKEGSKEFETIKDFVSSNTDHRIDMGTEYLEKDELIAFTYYSLKDKKLDRFMFLIKNGNLLLHQKTDEGMDGIATESFFLFGKFLIFVKNRNTLVIHEI